MIKLGSKLKILKTASKATALLPNGQISKVASAEDNSEYSNDFLYFIARALTANVPNANGDYFPEDELQKSYQSFIGKNLHLNHDADDVAKAVGKIIDAWFVKNEDDIYVVCLCKVDKKLHPELARNIETGVIDSVSMGCSCQECECSICGCKAHNESEMCEHLKNFLGREIDVNGEKKKVSSINRGITFNELSLVGDPADSNAHMYQIYANKRGNDMKKKAMQDGKTEDVVQDEVKKEIEKTLEDKADTTETTKADVKEEIKEVEDKLKEVKEIVEEKKEELKDLKEEVKDIKEEKVEEKKEEIVEEKKEETEEKVEKEESCKKAETEEEIKGIEEIKEKAEEAVKEDKEKSETETKTETTEETKEEIVEETKEEKKDDKVETLEDVQEKVEDIKEEIVAEIGDLFSPVKDETKEFAITDIFEDNGEKFVETEVEGKKKVYALKNVKLKKSAKSNIAAIYNNVDGREYTMKWDDEFFNQFVAEDGTFKKEGPFKTLEEAKENFMKKRPHAEEIVSNASKDTNVEKQAEAPAKPTTAPSAGMKWVFNQSSNTWEQKPENTKTVEVQATKKIAKSVKELSREELIELKQHYYTEKNKNVSWGELADIDSLVSDEEIFKEYADTDFVDEDFAINSNKGKNVKKTTTEYKYTLIKASKQPRWLVIDKATNKIAQKLYLKDLPKEASSFEYKKVIASAIKEVGLNKVASKLGVSKTAIKADDKYTLIQENGESATVTVKSISINDVTKETFINVQIGDGEGDNIFSLSKFMKMMEEGQIQKAEEVKEEVVEEKVVEETTAENGVETTKDTVPMNQDETSEPMNDLQSARKNRVQKKAEYYNAVATFINPDGNYFEHRRFMGDYTEEEIIEKVQKEFPNVKAEDITVEFGVQSARRNRILRKASFWEVKKDEKTGKYYLESANGKYKDEEGHTYMFNSREDALEEIDFLDAEHKYKKEMKNKKKAQKGIYEVDFGTIEPEYFNDYNEAIERARNGMAYTQKSINISKDGELISSFRWYPFYTEEDLQSFDEENIEYHLFGNGAYVLEEYKMANAKARLHRKADAGDGQLVPQPDPTPDFKLAPEVKPNETNTLEVTDEKKDVIKREITPMEEIANLMNVLQIKLSEVDDQESKLDFVRKEIQDAIDYVEGKPIEEIENKEEEPEIAEFTDIKWEESDNADLPMVASVDVDDINWNNINARKDGAMILAHIYKAKPVSYKVAFKKANKMNKTAAKITKVTFVDVLKAEIESAKQEVEVMKMTAQIKEKKEECVGIAKEAEAKGLIDSSEYIKKFLIKGMNHDDAREMAVKQAADEYVKSLMAMDKVSLANTKKMIANFKVPVFKTKAPSIGRITASCDYDEEITQNLPWSRKR